MYNTDKMNQIMKMKYYFKNLLLALLGRNPFRLELDKVKQEYALTAKRVWELDEIRYKLEAKMAETYSQMEATGRKITDYQNLTENLRKRVTEKDILLDEERRDKVAVIKRMKEEHEVHVKALKTQHETELEALRDQYEREKVDRHEEYEERMSDRDEKIAALREDLDRTLELLQEANRAIAKDIMAQSLLDKTNNGLEELYAAMQSGDTEKITMAMQYLDWSNVLPRIAHQHLMVLRRKNELVERIHFTDDDNVNYE